MFTDKLIDRVLYSDSVCVTVDAELYVGLVGVMLIQQIHEGLVCQKLRATGLLATDTTQEKRNDQKELW